MTKMETYDSMSHEMYCDQLSLNRCKSSINESIWFLLIIICPCIFGCVAVIVLMNYGVQETRNYTRLWHKYRETKTELLKANEKYNQKMHHAPNLGGVNCF